MDVEVLAPAAEPGSAQGTGSARGAKSGNEECAVLSAAEYGQAVTEVLIEELTAITGAELSRVRDRLVTMAGRHRWLSGTETDIGVNSDGNPSGVAPVSVIQVRTTDGSGEPAS